MDPARTIPTVDPAEPDSGTAPGAYGVDDAVGAGPRGDGAAGPPPARGGWARLAALVAVVVLAAVLLHMTGATHYLTISRLRALRDEAGVLAPLLFVVAYALGTVFAFPGAILSLSGGLLFGTLEGGALIVVGATIGATIAFFVARRAGRATVERFVSGGRLERLDRSVASSGLGAVVFTRLVPVLPFNVLNFAWGLTGVSGRDYVLGTLVGIVPVAFVYANLADKVARSLEGGDGSLASIDPSRLLTRDVLVALGLLAACAVIPPVVRRLAGRRTKGPA